MIEAIENTGAYYPNKMGRVFLQTLESVLLLDGYSNLLQMTDYSHFSEKLPPDNWTKAFNFNIVSSLNEGLEKMYGPRGGRRLAISAGEKFFEQGWGSEGYLSGTGSVALKARTLPEKLESGFNSLARQISDISDQTTWVILQERQLQIHVDQCPVCWGRLSDHAVCFHMVGFLQAAAHWYSSGLEFRVKQTSCKAIGEEACVFRIDIEPIK